MRHSVLNGLGFVAILVAGALTGTRADAKLAELLVTAPDGLKAIELEKADVKATVDYTTARVTYDMTFVSERSGGLEGTFYFALPRGAYVHEFGMWINGAYQGSAIVEAEAGRVAYETIVRRGIDPALLEWTAGNNFKMRVFPVLPNKPTRVVLTVGMPLELSGGRLRAGFPLDLGKVGKLTVAVEGRVHADETPTLSGIKGFKLEEKSDEGGVLTFAGSWKDDDLLPPDLLAFSVEEEDRDEVKVRREDGDEQRYFEAHAFPDLPPSLRPKAERAVVYWDYSLSEEEHKAARLEALEHYLKARKPASVEIWGFNQQVFEVAKGLRGVDAKDIAAVLAQIAKFPFDGGTRIDRLMAHLKGAAPKWTGAATDLVLFTNGVDSFELFDAKSLAGLSRPDLSAFIIAPTTGANGALLGVLAKTFDAVILDQDEDLRPEAFAAMPWTVDSVRVSKSLDAVVNASGATIFPGDGVVLRGQVKKDGKVEIVTTLKQGSKSKTLNWNFDTDDAKREKTKTVPRLWAAQRILELTAAKRANGAVIKALALDHQLMSPQTVMVVLEHCEDYREFKLTPAKGCTNRPTSSRWTDGGDDDDEESVEEEMADAATEDDSEGGGADLAAASPQAAAAPAPDMKRKSIDFDSVDIGGQRRTPVELSLPASDAVMAPSGASAGAEPAAPARDDDLEEIIAEMDANPESSAVAADDGFEGESEDEDYEGNDTLEPDTLPRLFGFETSLTEAAARGADKLYATYLKTRDPYAKIPYYYVFAAEAFAKMKRLDLADLVLSNVVEVRPGDARWLRIYAYDLVAWGKAADAIPVYRAVTELRGEDPQSFRDFGLALEAVGQPVLAMRQFERVYKGKWDERLQGMNRIILHDLARAAGKALKAASLSADDRQKAQAYAKVDQSHGDKLVVTVSWDTDGTDIDLHVVEPGGRHVYYGNKAPAGGAGTLSWDSTQGFGPEQYRSALPYRGAYRVALHYYANNPSALADGTFARLDFKQTESGVTREWTQTVFLKDSDETRTIATIEVKDPAARVPAPEFKALLSTAKAKLEKGGAAEALRLLQGAGVQAKTRDEGQRQFHIARAQIKLKQYDAAEESNQRALASDPTLIAAHYNNACAASLNKNAKRATFHLGLLADALKRAPEKRTFFTRLMKTDADLAFARATPGYKTAFDRIVVGH